MEIKQNVSFTKIGQYVDNKWLEAEFEFEFGHGWGNDPTLVIERVYLKEYKALHNRPISVGNHLYG